MASIYLRNKTWWITYRVGGRNICHSLGTKNAREAEAMKHRYEALKTNNLLPEPSKTAIEPFLNELCKYWRMERKGKGAENDIGRLRTFFGPCCEEMRLKRHTPRAFLDDHAEMPRARDERSGGYLPIRHLEQITPAMTTNHLRERYLAGEICGKTANHLRAVLSSMFGFAIDHFGYRCPDPKYRHPAQSVPRFKEVHPEIIWLTSEDIEQQLAALKDQQSLHAQVATYIFAGLRRSEGVWLTREDVDLQERVIRVRRKTIDGKYWEPKTGKDRVVPISNSLLGILAGWLSHSRGTWLFSSPDGCRWHPDNFADILRESNAAHGLDWSCAHFRHTFGSHLAQKGISLYKISELMGNSPEICRKHYAALMPQKMHAEVEF